MWTSLLTLSALVASAAAATGGRFCDENVCISGIRNAGTDTYTITPVTAIPHDSFGWIAMGFGKSMVGSPMVIMWPNADGSDTLSQREADAHAPPGVTAAPPRVAKIDEAKSYSNSSATAFTFSIPSDSQGTFPIIYAFSPINPNSSAATAPILKHEWVGHANMTMNAKVSSSGKQCKTKRNRVANWQ